MDHSPAGDARAVAPVVGIALLIAITVILVGVVSGVILGFSGSPSDPPQATLSFSAGNTTVELTHEGGQALNPDTIIVRYDGTELNLDSSLRAGESQEIIDTGDGDPGFETADRITVVWQDPESDSETILATFKP